MTFFTAYDKKDNKYRFEIAAEYEGGKRYFANLSTINNIVTNQDVVFEAHGGYVACQNTIAGLKQDVMNLVYSGEFNLISRL